MRVLFVDVVTGIEIARTELPATQLPDSFAPATTVELGDATWSVERADPPTAAQFRAAGALTLTVRCVETVSPANILYSLPTICDAVPRCDAVGDADRFELHEDDWRQVEFVGAGLAGVVEAQLRAVREIYKRHAVGTQADGLTGFRAIHIRSEPVQPLPTAPSRQHLLALLSPAPPRPVGLRGQPGTIRDSFAVPVGPLMLYGIAEPDAIRVLGLHPAGPHNAGRRTFGPLASLQQGLRSFDPTLVDWCRCATVRTDSLADYLSGR